jgi:hypothetical protein
MNTYTKSAANPREMNTSKIIGLKVSCHEHLQKMGVGEVLLLPNSKEALPVAARASICDNRIRADRTDRDALRRCQNEW